MPDELVSIIMPAYNSSDTIYESIVSAVSQSHGNIELIIVDDGSTDDTAEVCQRHRREDERIKLISQRNRGVSAARNTGIQMARGDYIAFLDADDLWEKDKIKLQLNIARMHPDVVVLTELVRFSGDGNSRKFFTKTDLPIYTGKDQYIRTVLNLHNHEMGLFGTALVRKAHLKTVGLFDEKLRTSEDWDLWIRLAFHYSFANIDKPLRLYRKYARSLTTRTRMENTLQGQLYIIDKVKNCGMLPPSDISTARMNKFLEFAGHYRYQDMPHAACRMLARAVVACPVGCAELFLKKLSKKLLVILLHKNHL